MGVATGCGCKEVYRFPHTPLVYVLFLQQHPYFFVHFLNVFRSCSSTFLNVLNIFFAQYYCINTHTGNYGRPTASI